MYTAFEVSKHCFQHDCWVIIDNKVYDVTSYVPRHPGGALIYVKAGGDCTQLFESYHLSSHRARYGMTTACQRRVVTSVKYPLLHAQTISRVINHTAIQGSTAKVLRG